MAVSQSNFSSESNVTSYQVTLTADGDIWPADVSGSPDFINISRSDFVIVHSRGTITADTIEVQASLIANPSVAADWQTLNNDSGNNPFAATNDFFRWNVEGMRAMRIVRSGAADGPIVLNVSFDGKLDG